MSVIAVVGATATGKSDLAIEIARRIDGEIVNADALQVYRGLDIGTAKPPLHLLEEIPHHLIDILEPEEAFSAGDFSRFARKAILEIESRHRTPIVVGGSGLYLRALFEGLSPLPIRDFAIRKSLEDKLRAEGLSSLRATLAKVDPESAANLSAGDTQRILRALEVFLVSGKTIRAWWAEPRSKEPIQRIVVGLTVPRTILYDRIAVRVRQMVERGWVDEVSRLLENGVPPTAFAFQAIGYRQMVDALLGRCTLETATEEAIRATRHYAKRQDTWFRREREVFWIQGPRAEVAIPFVLQELKSRGAFAR